MRKKTTVAPLRAAASVTLLLFGTAAVAASTTAVGSSGELPREPELRGYRRIGPFFYRSAIRVKAFGYDDNVLLSRGGGQGDLLATFGPELHGVIRLSRRAWASAQASVDYTGYARHSFIDHFDNARGAQFTTWAGDLRLSAAYEDARVLRRPSSEVDDRVRADLSTERLSALYEATPATRFELALARWRERYGMVSGTDYDAALGHDDAAITFSVSHRLTGATWAVLEAASARREGRTRDGLRDDARRQALVGLDFDPGARIQGGLRAGVAVVTTPHREPESRQEFHGMTARGDLALRVTGRSLVRIVLRRDFTPSTWLDNVYFRNDTTEVSAQRELTSRAAVEAGLSRGWNVYPDRDPSGRTDRIVEPFAGARVRLGGEAVLAIRAGWWSRRSTVAGEDRERFVISQSVTVPL